VSSPPVRGIVLLVGLTSVDLAGVLAFAGASATIASDALMNPFDGVLIPLLHVPMTETARKW